VKEVSVILPTHRMEPRAYLESFHDKLMRSGYEFDIVIVIELVDHV
jgi:hypothetical protein